MSGRCRDWPCSPGSCCPTCDPEGYAARERRGPRCFHCDGRLDKGGPTRTVQSHGPRVLHERCFDEWERDSYPHPCPKCEGKGAIPTRWTEKKECCVGGNPVFSPPGPCAGCEYCPDLKTIKVAVQSETCELCEGKGRLRTKPVPITETKVIGWKKSDI